MDEPYREPWMHSYSLRRLQDEIKETIEACIREGSPLWTALPKSQGLIDQILPYVESLERQYHWQ